MSEKQLSICYFPGRESTYSRTRVLLKGMREAGINVLDCSSPHKNSLRYIVGCWKFLYYKNNCDVIFIGFLGQFLVLLIRLFTKKKILFDAFVSIYQTMAFDRKKIRPSGYLAKAARFMDKRSCVLADIIFLDTHQHISYFVNEFGLEERKFHRLLVGSDDSVMKPIKNQNSNEFIVHFHGEYQPLHGSEYIVEAARLLPNIKFRMIGKGRGLIECIEKTRRYNLTNIEFIDSVSYENLAKYMAEASVCLGIFGNTQKVQLVIPHKVYEALAMAKPVITADTPAARELLTHNENALLCACANPEKLAEAIKILQADGTLREKIAKNGYKTFYEQCRPEILGNQIKKIATEILR